METKKKSTLSFGLRYGYGLGEFGLNFLLTYITYYLTFYLTNVAGLSMTLAATVPQPPRSSRYSACPLPAR